jgi:predicted ABC-type transport system involved in lysophospholipase L1 biosynthesis ATPase subunit
MKFKTTITRTAKVLFDARLKQTQGIFDLPPAATQTLDWNVDVELPDQWSVGAIVGESGSGKTTLARELASRFGSAVIEAKDAAGNLREPFEWARDKAVCSAMPGMPIREWTGLLSRVGFSSPPAWCRPYQVLSNGQQFRCNLARAIAESGASQIDGPAKPVFFDEFASLVHDQVAAIASAAVAKGVRQLGRRFVAVTWRTDILDHLEPDWVLFVGTDQSVRLELNTSSREGVRRWRRPSIKMRIVRVDPSAWACFRGHHYLSGHCTSRRNVLSVSSVICRRRSPR